MHTGAQTERPKSGKAGNLRFPVGCGAMAAFQKSGSSSEEMEEQLVLDAVRAAALTCYAVEGAYPRTLEELERGYGLAYNRDAYIVVYDAFASNIMPDIQVLRKGADAR